MSIVIMNTIFAIGCAACATFTYYNGTIFPILSSILMNTMYMYTIIECNIEKIVKRVREYNVSQYEYINVKVVNYSPQHIFISHNEVVETRDSSELELMKVNNNDVYVCSYSKPAYPTLQLVEPSNVKFISFDVIFEDDSTKQGSKMFSIEAETECRFWYRYESVPKVYSLSVSGTKEPLKDALIIISSATSPSPK